MGEDKCDEVENDCIAVGGKYKESRDGTQCYCKKPQPRYNSENSKH